MATSNDSSVAAFGGPLPPDFWHSYFASVGGYSVPLVATNGLIALLSAAGIVLNAMLVVTTKRNKKLHGRCNLLIAFNSLAAIGILFGLMCPFFVNLFGVNFVPLLTCYVIYFVPFVGADLATSAQLCIGLDRLLSVLFPIWYKSSDKFKSFYVLISFCCARTLYLNAAYHYSVSLRPPTTPVMCTPGDIAGPEIGAFIYQEGLALFCAEFVCYSLVWLLLFCRKTEDDSKSVKRLMKSLTVIMCTSFFCYIQGNLWRVILPLLRWGPWEVQFYVGFPTNILYTIAFSSNTPILYAFSIEYRSAFKSTFGLKDNPNLAKPPNNNALRNQQPQQQQTGANNSSQL